MSLKNTARKTLRGGGKHPPMWIRVKGRRPKIHFVTESGILSLTSEPPLNGRTKFCEYLLISLTVSSRSI